MPIIDLQRRLREVGRIRLGEQVPSETPGGRARPKKLTKFRLTSRDRQVIEAAAELLGGEVRQWDAPDGIQWEVYTDADAITVVVPPTEMAFSQWYEEWSAGGCQKRCDGAWDHQRDTACTCDPEARECKMTTRLSVVVPDLPGLGLWRVESHGYYAAVELNGAVEVCQHFAASGQYLPARLRLEQRKVTRQVKGKVQTFRFAVPVLDVDVQMGRLAIGAGGGTPVAIGGPAGALPAPQPEALESGFTPTPEGAPAPSVADQIDAASNPAPKPRRANAAAPLPATGVAPRPAAAVPPPPAPAPGRAPAGVPSCVDCGGSLAGVAVGVRPGGAKFHKDGCPTGSATTGATPCNRCMGPLGQGEVGIHKVCPDEAGAPLPTSDPRADVDRQRRRFHAIAGKRWPGDNAAREAARHHWLGVNCAGVTSLNDLTAQQVAAAADRLAAEVDALAAQDEEGADVIAFPGAIDSTASEACRAVHPDTDADYPIECQRPAGHDGAHLYEQPNGDGLDVEWSDEAPPVEESIDPDDHTRWTEERWREEIAAVGVKPTAFVREAARIAPHTGEGDVAELADVVGKLSLTALMRSWLIEKGEGGA